MSTKRFVVPARPRLLSILGLTSTLALACVHEDEAALAELEDQEWLAGGEGTNTFMRGINAYMHPAANITREHRAWFFSGNSFFNSPWVTAPANTKERDGLGPLFNATDCSTCHLRDGRGAPPAPGEQFVGMLLRLSRPGQGEYGAPVPDPIYGGQLQPHAITGVAGEGRPRVEYVEVSGQYDDGEPYSLAAPTYHIDEPGYGPLPGDLMISPRVAPAVIGLGLLEAIPAARLRELEDPDDLDGDGISGRANMVWDRQLGALNIGRFGWKAEQPSVAQQSAGAFLGDIGMTTELFTEQSCTPAQTDCTQAPSGGRPEINPTVFARVVLYTQLLAVPVREQFDGPEILRGKYLFGALSCSGCHTPRHRTTSDVELEELRDQTIWPYTDLLLHDMGEGLSDHRPSYLAQGSEWRTPPLWGLHALEDVNGHQRLLHDGRARGVAEAILWHGGEAEGSADEFKALSSEDRRALVRFVESL